MKRFVVLVAATVTPALVAAQDGPRPISLAEAVDMARRNSPTMIQARGTLRTNAATIRAAKWAFLPQLNLSYGSSKSGGGTYVNDQLVTQASQGYGFSRGVGGLSVTLWDGGTKTGAVRRGQANLNASEASEHASQFTIAQQVKQQYYAILQQNETEANARAQLAQAEFQLQLSTARLRAGTAIISDSLNSVIAIGNANLAILNAQNARNNAIAQLTRLTGAAFPVTAIVSDTLDPAPMRLNEQELFAFAEGGPSVRQSEAQFRAAQIGEKTARAILWPQISLSGSYSQNNRDKEYDFGQGRANYSWSMSLGASYTLWNAYSRESNIISARVAADNAEANLREQKAVVRQNLIQQLGTLRTAEQTIAIQRLNIAAAEENLRVVSLRYERGSGLMLDVITAQNTLNNARASLTQARVNARNARAAIEAIIGRELPQ